MESNSNNNNNLNYKNKYALSDVQADRILSKLYTNVTKSISDSESPTEEAPSPSIPTMDSESLTREFLHKVTGVSSYEETLYNQLYNTTYNGLSLLYGFTSFSDMYLYAWSKDQESESESDSLVEKSNKGSNSNSNLVPVKRMVNRNGKQIEVTIWENPNKEDKGSTSDSKETTGRNKGNPSGSSSKTAEASLLSSKVIGDKNGLSPQEIAELKTKISHLLERESRFSDVMDFYIALEDDNQQVIGVIGIKEEGNYLTMPFVEHDGSVKGIAVRGFFETIKLAIDIHKGVKMKDFPSARVLFEEYGMEKKGSDWVIEADELKEHMGYTEEEDSKDKKTPPS